MDHLLMLGHFLTWWIRRVRVSDLPTFLLLCCCSQARLSPQFAPKSVTAAQWFQPRTNCAFPSLKQCKSVFLCRSCLPWKVPKSNAWKSRLPRSLMPWVGFLSSWSKSLSTRSLPLMRCRYWSMPSRNYRWFASWWIHTSGWAAFALTGTRCPDPSKCFCTLARVCACCSWVLVLRTWSFKFPRRELSCFRHCLGKCCWLSSWKGPLDVPCGQQSCRCSSHREAFARFRNKAWWSSSGADTSEEAHFGSWLCIDQDKCRDFVFDWWGRRCTRCFIIGAIRLPWWGSFGFTCWRWTFLDCREVAFFTCGCSFSMIRLSDLLRYFAFNLINLLLIANLLDFKFLICFISHPINHI